MLADPDPEAEPEGTEPGLGLLSEVSVDAVGLDVVDAGVVPDATPEVEPAAGTVPVVVFGAAGVGGVIPTPKEIKLTCCAELLTNAVDVVMLTGLCVAGASCVTTDPAEGAAFVMLAVKPVGCINA